MCMCYLRSWSMWLPGWVGVKTLDKRLQNAAILMAGAYDSRFELYAHEIMAAAFGTPADVIALPAAGGGPYGLTEQVPSPTMSRRHLFTVGSFLPQLYKPCYLKLINIIFIIDFLQVKRPVMADIFACANTISIFSISRPVRRTAARDDTF